MALKVALYDLTRVHAVAGATKLTTSAQSALVGSSKAAFQGYHSDIWVESGARRPHQRARKSLKSPLIHTFCKCSRPQTHAAGCIIRKNVYF